MTQVVEGFNKKDKLFLVLNPNNISISCKCRCSSNNKLNSKSDTTKSKSWYVWNSSKSCKNNLFNSKGKDLWWYNNNQTILNKKENNNRRRLDKKIKIMTRKNNKQKFKMTKILRNQAKMHLVHLFVKFHREQVHP
jgi:hypothetical protein